MRADALAIDDAQADNMMVVSFRCFVVAVYSEYGSVVIYGTS